MHYDEMLIACNYVLCRINCVDSKWASKGKKVNGKDDKCLSDDVDG